MDEEREMCQNCKKDIPIVNYRTHTLHCARNMVKCRECEAMVGRPDLESHLMEFHTLRVCNQCQVNVEAFKLPEHMKTLCSKRKLVCKYCSSDKLASEMTDHENRCGVRTDRCERCHEWVQLKEWDSHQSRYHGHMGRRFRERSVIANTNPNEESFVSTLPNTVDEENPMLPCEFCEGMIPMRKLLEHQAECVNPTNVRRSESITNLSQLSSSSLSTYRPLSGIRQYSTASLKRSPPSLQRKVSAPARYGTLDRHTNESVTHQTENVTSRHQTESSSVTNRYTSSHQSSDVTNRYSASHTTANDASNRHTTSQQHTNDVAERHTSTQNEDSSNKLPCEFCNEPQEMEYLMKHQRSCSKNPESGSSSCYDSPSSLRRSCSSSVRNYSSLNRAASVREARATTEDRTFARSLSRQSSFTERSFSRRSDSIYSGGTGQMYTRGSLGLSRYNAGPDYAAATRRSALFDGYTGFAIYSSISQGLDEITYGGRRSRRNSVTESSYGYQRRGSLTGSAFEYSALVSATATANAMTQSNRYNNTNAENTTSPPITRDASDSVINSPKNRYTNNEAVTTSAPIVRDSSDSVINSPKSSTALSRQDSTRYSSSVCQSDSAYESSSSKAISTSSTASTISPSTMLQPMTSSSSGGAGGGGVISRQESLRQSKSSSKIERKVSFSGADPIVLESSPPKPRRIKEKSERRKKAESSKNCDDLFDQVSAKLRALEQEQQEKLELEVPQSPLSRVPPTSLFPSTSTSARTTSAKPSVQMPEVGPSSTATTTFNVSATVTLNGSQSSVKVKELPTPEVITSPYNDVTIAASLNDVTITAKEESSSKYCQSYYNTPSFREEPVRVDPVYPELASPIVTDVTKSDVVIIRDKSSRGPGESKSSSKRNSLDNKTVQTLAQDLAAECAKAYALMESSLSKLSTDFAVGPFGLTPKNKKTRKSRPPPAEPLK